MKISNKILIVALLVLAGVFVLAKIFRSPRLESNLDRTLAQADTSKISHITITQPGAEKTELRLKRNGNRWEVQYDQRTEPASPSAVREVLTSLAGMKAERMVSRKKEKWNTYQVGDSTGTHVVAYADKRSVADVWIGKTGFNQSSGMYGGNGFTYVRPGDGDEVYTVDGFLSPAFSKTFDDWRDKSFLRLRKGDITRITFHYPTDSGFVAEKVDKTWMIGDQKADSVKMENYLNRILSKNLFSFADDFSPEANPDVTIVVERDQQQLAVVKAWKGTDENWVLTSTLQENVYFSSAGSSIIKDLFASKKSLLP